MFSLRTTFVRAALRGTILSTIVAAMSLPGLAQPLAAGSGKFLGCSTSAGIWPNLDQYWDQVTPGNDGKWGSVESSQGVFTWTNLDNIYQYATSRGFPFKEHNLVWGSQQPGWITLLDSATQRSYVEGWIQAVCQRYPQTALIDVVNEPFHSVPPYANALGGNGKTGWDWVVTAFTWAREYAPAGAKLLLNEYNIVGSNTATTNYINLIDTLKVRGLIDGIGVQGHYFEFRSQVHATSNIYQYSISTIQSNLNRLTATGLPVYLSEFDIDEPADSDQLAQYQIYFPIFWSNPGVKGMTLWGYIQSDVWNAHPNTYLLLSDGTERPALKWLRHYVRYGPVPATTSALAPINTTNEARMTTFRWKPATYATSYEIQVALDPQCQVIAVDDTLSDTTVTLSFPLDASTQWYWHVAGIDSAGEGAFSTPVGFMTGTELGVSVQALAPGSFELRQNYPNPFNPATVISYHLAVGGFTTLKVYDILGKEVATLVNGMKNAGTYSVRFDGANLPTGIYFYRLRSGKFSGMKKLVLMK
ncbi:MAG TPA: endo-1,4-beta-xylanase [Bacteroidota bacterium]|nr:endo-1,4-beta-xylanase [Bacteroidota bacterium]